LEVIVDTPVPTQRRHRIDDVSRVGDARREAVRLAQLQGLSEEFAGRAALVATELATNLLRHGGGGELLLQRLDGEGACLVEIVALDRGPGMKDPERCLRDGYSTSGTLGTGLGAAQRLSAEFDLYSAPEDGTVVLARVGVGSMPRLGVVNVAVQGEVECGDTWAIAHLGKTMSLLVVDGLGHGTFAAQAAQAARTAFERSPGDTPQELLARLNRSLAGTRGAAAACAQFGPSGALSYAGIGNIHGAVLTGESMRGLVSHNGTLGLRAPRIQQFEYEKPSGALLIMNSDGLSARWNLARKPGLLRRHPGVVAAVLFRDYARRHDDATVVVLN
jgi:anti-sigma regulatory factor (Ser/Thr protein kinase)